MSYIDTDSGLSFCDAHTQLDMLDRYIIDLPGEGRILVYATFSLHSFMGALDAYYKHCDNGGGKNYFEYRGAE